MNILGLNISISRRSSSPAVSRSATETPVSQLSPEAIAWLTGNDLPAPGPSLGSAYEQVVWIYRAVNALAEQVANIPFLFSSGTRGREHLITSGPLLDFYNRPHPMLNRFQYWELRVLWLMLRGECFRVPIFNDGSTRLFRAPRAKLSGVLIADPARFQPIFENNNLLGWRYTAGARIPLDSQVFLPEEIWFERLPNPFDFWRGLAPLQVASLPTTADFAASWFMRNLLENNAENGFIIRSEQQLSPEQREQITSALRQRRHSPGAAARSILLWGANEIIQPRLSSADLQFLENRKFSRAEICAAFGVPEEIVTSTDHAKYDVMQGARLNFIENRVAPLCARLEAEEQAVIKTIDPNAVGWFDLDSLPIMQQARRTRLAAAKTGFDMGIPFNELNRVLDLGFQPLPWGHQGFLSNTLSPAANRPATSPTT